MAQRNFTDSEEAEIAKLYQAGHSARAIARAYGFGHHISIVAALRRQGVEQRSPGERNRKYALNPHAFDRIDSEAAAYWYGFLYADGCVVKRTLTVNVKTTDACLLLGLRGFLSSESPISHRIHGGENGKVYPHSHIEFTDQHLAARMRELGMVARRRHPERIWKAVPSRLTHHWLRGFFDGDGSARKSSSLVFCGGQKLMLWVRQVLADNTGTNPDLAVTKHRTANVYYLYISGRRQALKVAEYLYRGATMWLGRKREVINSWPTP